MNNTRSLDRLQIRLFAGHECYYKKTVDINDEKELSVLIKDLKRQGVDLIKTRKEVLTDAWW